MDKPLIYIYVRETINIRGLEFKKQRAYPIFRDGDNDTFNVLCENDKFNITREQWKIVDHELKEKADMTYIETAVIDTWDEKPEITKNHK